MKHCYLRQSIPIEIVSILFVFFLITIYGCSKATQTTVQNPPPSWESMAEGYAPENSFAIIGSEKYTHLRERTADGQLFDFVLKIGPPKNWTQAKEEVTRFWGWGEATEAPKRLKAARHVLKLSLVLGIQKVYIPESCYVDLVDLKVGRCQNFLFKNDSSVFFYLEGADAGESYNVKFTIKDARITKREIWRGEFPEFGPETKIFKKSTSCDQKIK